MLVIAPRDLVFGDDYLTFWAKNSYHIVLNTNLFSNHSGAPDLYEAQFRWLEHRLTFAHAKHPDHIFVFGHHPWFIYHDQEESEDMEGASKFPREWIGTGLGGGTEQPIPDRKFHICRRYRDRVMNLFRDYHVRACFAGHFHQNHVAWSSFGMEMVITSSLSMVFESSGIEATATEPKGVRGVRVVEVQQKAYQHRFLPL